MYRGAYTTNAALLGVGAPHICTNAMKFPPRRCLEHQKRSRRRRVPMTVTDARPDVPERPGQQTAFLDQAARVAGRRSVPMSPVW
jgi:hypothetical protein